MRTGLEGKVVLVTGGTKGIGRAIAEAFLAESAHVHFCARTAADVFATQAELRLAHPHALSHAKPVGAVVDVTNEAAVRDWVSRCAAAHGGTLDVVVANVSALATSDDAAAWDAALRTDLLGSRHLIDAARPFLQRSALAGGGNVVAVASVSGRDVDVTAPGPYGAAKAALIHYVAQLARADFAARGMRANTVSPGNVYFPDGFWGKVEREKPDVFAAQTARNPTGRMCRPDEVAGAVVFLASERASFISGTNLVVDGALCTGVQF